MATIYHASLETARFSFDAYGDSEASARAALFIGLTAHAEQYGLDVRWAEELMDPDAGNVDLVAADIGRCYRDRQPDPLPFPKGDHAVGNA